MHPQGCVGDPSLKTFRMGVSFQRTEIPMGRIQPQDCHPGPEPAVAFFMYSSVPHLTYCTRPFLGGEGVTDQILEQNLTNGKLQRGQEMKEPEQMQTPNQSVLTNQELLLSVVALGQLFKRHEPGEGL